MIDIALACSDAIAFQRISANDYRSARAFYADGLKHRAITMPYRNAAIRFQKMAAKSSADARTMLFALIDTTSWAIEWRADHAL